MIWKFGNKRYLSSESFFEEVFFGLIKTFFLSFIVFVTLFPFWNTIVISFNQALDTTRGGLFFWPRIWTLSNYKAIWTSARIPQAFLVSVERTVLSTVLNLFLTTMLAYALSRKNYILRRPLTLIVVLQMYVNAGLFPYYFLIRSLHLNGTFWVYVIPSLVAAFNFIVIRTYIKTIPDSIFESARIDGTSDFQIFLRFVLPLSKPVLATVALFVAVGAWNAWFDTLLFNSSKPDLFTLQYRLMSLLQSSMSQSRSAADLNALGLSANAASSTVTPISIRAAITIVATVPILVVYPFLQRYFVTGMTLGSIKE
jgi:putative aldouronate transport system permease protein